MPKSAHWTKGRDSLIKTLDAGRPLSFCWRVLEHVAAAYARAGGIIFLGLPNCERKAMRVWLATLS